MSVHELRALLHLVRRADAITRALTLRLNAELTRRSTVSGCAVDPHREITRHGGLRSRDLRGLEVQTTAVTAAPALGDLLAVGATTAAHVESVGQAIRVAGEGAPTLLGRLPAIAERAVTMTADDFDRYVKRLARDAQPDEGVSHLERQRRRTHLRTWNDRDGMTRLSGAFDPERGAALVGLLDRSVEAMFHTGDRDAVLEVAPGIEPNDHRRAVALHALCTRGPAIDAEPGGAVAPRPTRAEVIVHVDLVTLQTGRHPNTTCRTGHGADLPPATVRRIACDADIIPVVLNGAGVPIDVGRAKRLATVHQRRALEAVHTTCAIDGCHVGFTHCTVHHLRPWEAGGGSDLANLVPLCSRHHHAAHEGGWRLHLDPRTRHLTVTLPGQPVDDRDDDP